MEERLEKQLLSATFDVKRHMTNIYLIDSDEETIVDFVKDHDKTNDKFKDKARKDCLWEGFTSNHNLSVKVCKTFH